MQCPAKKKPAPGPNPVPGGTPLAPAKTLPRALPRKRVRSGEVEILEGGGAGGSKPRARATALASARKIQKTTRPEWGSE